MTQDLRAIAAAEAGKAGLPPELVRAVIQTESCWNPWAWNPEHQYRWYWNVKTRRPFRTLSQSEVESERPPHDFETLAGDPDQEWWGQSASWGLMQVMGAVARELGFRGDYLPNILLPELNIALGCQQLGRLRDRWHKRLGWDGVISAYNAGFPRKYVDNRWVNQGYVDKVRAALAQDGGLA